MIDQPPEWALREAHKLWLNAVSSENGYDSASRAIALALDAAWRRGIEEAARVAGSAKLPEHYRWGHDAMEQFTFGLRRAVEAIRALADKEPT